MEFPVRKLLSCKDSIETLAWWEMVFGRNFPSVRRFLTPCTGKRADFYPCPDDSVVQLTIRESGEKYRAVPTGEHAEDFDAQELEWADVQAYTLDPQVLIAFIRNGFGVKAVNFQSLEKLECLGSCSRSKRSVYACFAVNEADALSAVSSLSSAQTAGCIFFSERFSAVESLLHSRGIASVFLSEICIADQSACPAVCRKLERNISNTELKEHLDVRFDTIEETVLPSAVRGAATVRFAATGGHARAEQYQPKYEEAKKYILDYHRKNPLVSFNQTRKKAAQHLYLSESTLKNHVKKRDFTDW